MKKKILISVGMATLFLCTSWQETETTVLPGRLFLADNGKSLFVTNRAGCELVRMPSDRQKMEKKVSFSPPVNAMMQDASDKPWMVCDGDYGIMHESDGKELPVQSEIKSGATPPGILYNPLSKSFWVTRRLSNELWEIDSATRKVKAKIAVGREPVSMAAFAGDSCLLIVNNLSEIPSTAYPVAMQPDIIDVLSKRVSGRAMLPNGSTDVKSVTVDKDHTFAYVTHLIFRHQLPTNQLDRGWMVTNTLSIIDSKARKWFTSVILDTSRKGAANPWAVIVIPNDRQIIAATTDSRELVRIDCIALREHLTEAKQEEMVTPSVKVWGNILNDAGFLYGIHDFIPTQGKGPRSMVATRGKIYTANCYTSELMSADLNGKNVQKQVLSAPLTFTKVGKGDMCSHNATTCFQNWQSCATCHPNGTCIDGFNRDLPNDGTGNLKDTKTPLLSHQAPLYMMTGIRKSVEVAVRSGVKYALFMEGENEIYEPIDEYSKFLKSLPNFYLQNGKLSVKVKSGKEIFEENCASCRPGQYYTDPERYKVDQIIKPDKGLSMDVPALNKCWRTAPYLYDGCSYSIKDMPKVHGPHEPVSEKELEELEEYVLSLQ